MRECALPKTGLRGPIVRTHPLTGEPIVPIGTVSGKAVWPIMGGAPDLDDGDGDGNDDDLDDKDDDKDQDKSGKGSSASDDDKVSKSDYESMKGRARKEKEAREAAEAELKKIQDSKKDELTKAQESVATLETENARLKEQVSSLTLKNAFLSANKVSWHDPDTALSVAQSKGILDDVIDNDGEVDKGALTKALAKLADEHKYLVNGDGKSKDGKDDDDDEGDKQASGEPATRRSKNKKDKQARQQELRGRFQSLR